MSRFVKDYWCAKCGVKASEPYKVYWEHGDLYRTIYDLKTYCKECAETVMAQSHLDRLLHGD